MQKTEGKTFEDLLKEAREKKTEKGKNKDSELVEEHDSQNQGKKYQPKKKGKGEIVATIIVLFLLLFGCFAVCRWVIFKPATTSVFDVAAKKAEEVRKAAEDLLKKIEEVDNDSLSSNIKRNTEKKVSVATKGDPKFLDKLNESMKSTKEKKAAGKTLSGKNAVDKNSKLIKKNLKGGESGIIVDPNDYNEVQ